MSSEGNGFPRSEECRLAAAMEGGTNGAIVYGAATTERRSFVHRVTRACDRVGLLVFGFGLLLHLPQIPRIGPVGDDVVQYVLPHYAAAGSLVQFLLIDATGFLARGERPGAYVPYLLGRAAYLLGFPVLLAFAAVLAAAAAAMFVVYLGEIERSARFRLAAGILLITWPIAVPIGFWPSTIHFTWASICALAAAGLALRGRRRRAWSLLLHVAAIATLEIYFICAPFLIATALIASWLGIAPRERATAQQARTNLIAMCALSVVYGIWRFVFARLVATPRLDYESAIGSASEIVERAALGLGAVFWPWPGAWAAVSAAPFSLGVTLSFAAVTVLLCLITSLLDGSARIAAPKAFASLLPGLALLLHWLPITALAPGALTLKEPVGLASRLNYPIAQGVAALLAGALVIVVSASRRWFGRTADFALIFALVVAASAGTAVIWRAKALHAGHWDSNRSLLRKVKESCPGIAADSVVVIEGSPKPSLARMGRSGMSFYELSGLLIVLYDDASVRGFWSDESRLAGNGVRPLVWNDPGQWNAREDSGYLYLRPRSVVSPFDRSRLITVSMDKFGDPELSPAIAHSRRGASYRWLENNLERCLQVPRNRPSTSFCHLLPEFCHGSPE